MGMRKKINIVFSSQAIKNLIVYVPADSISIHMHMQVHNTITLNRNVYFASIFLIEFFA